MKGVKILAIVSLLQPGTVFGYLRLGLRISQANSSMDCQSPNQLGHLSELRPVARPSRSAIINAAVAQATAVDAPGGTLPPQTAPSQRSQES